MINATSYTNRNASESAGNDDDFARYSGYAPPGASDERGVEDPRYSGYAAPATSGSILRSVPSEARSNRHVLLTVYPRYVDYFSYLVFDLINIYCYL